MAARGINGQLFAGALLAFTAVTVALLTLVQSTHVQPALVQDGGALAPRAEPRCFFIAQLADAQLGMVRAGSKNASEALDWSGERAMLDLAVRHLNRLRPRFVLLSGDMQNWFPTTSRGPSAQNGVLAYGYGDVGAAQAMDVRHALDALEVPLLGATPGNHDVGDVPDLSTLRSYKARWREGSAPVAARLEGGVLFLFVNSQIVMNASELGVAVLRDAQRAWLLREIAGARQAGAVGIVLCTHVPPFVGAADEPEGWANWPQAERAALLSALMRQPHAPALDRPALRPRLVLAGHFHGNARAVSSAFGAPLEVVTTSAVGAPILWLGKQSSTFTPDEVARISGAPTGTVAYLELVARDAGTGELNWTQAAERVQARPDRSGVRVVEFCTGAPGHARYRHRWLTLDALGALDALERAWDGGLGPTDVDWTSF
jgi:hypothetical protein